MGSLTPMSDSLSSSSDGSGKRVFANRARSFANLPPFAAPMIALSLAAVPVAVVSGAFGTGRFDLLPRTAFWLLLILSASALWLAIPYRWFDRRPGWHVTVPLAILATAAAMPLLIEFYGRLLFGQRMLGSVLPIVAQSIVIGGAIWGGVVLVRRLLIIGSPETAPEKGLLFRARIDPAALRRIEAQDHYVRLVDADGGERLIHGRYSDYVGEVAALDGLEVRRGTWIAAADVAEVERDGRRWQVISRDGSTVTASEAGARRMREAGWI